MLWFNGGLALVVLILALKLWSCCKKLNELYDAFIVLNNWVITWGFHEWADCVNTTLDDKHQKDCTPGQEKNWPPPDPPGFPI